MRNDVFINRLSPYLPNNPVSNDEMEDYLGLIEGKISRVRRIVLKQNGINTRYYALNKKQEIHILMRNLLLMQLMGCLLQRMK